MPDVFCMLGLPGSGKTSFLASLYEVVSHPDLEAAPRLDALPEDRAYLQGVHERWLRCEPALRTPQTEVPQTVQFDLLLPDETSRSVSIPDVAGEAVRTLWEERRWTGGLQAAAGSAAAVMLFVRANDVRPARRVQQILDPDAVVYRTEVEDDDPGASRFDPAVAPTQAKLVDIVESLLGVNVTRPLPLAVVVSAWDTVDTDNVSPLEFMRLRLPLLWQYLESNPERIEFRTFGVSAQGGDFSDAEQARRLVDVEPPSNRMLVVDAESRSHDVSTPLRWLWSRT